MPCLGPDRRTSLCMIDGFILPLTANVQNYTLTGGKADEDLRLHCDKITRSRQGKTSVFW